MSTPSGISAVLPEHTRTLPIPAFFAPAISVPSTPEVDDAVDMEFDVEEEASVDLGEVEVDDMDFNFDSESEDISPESIETDDIALNLEETEETPEIVADFDLDTESDELTLDLDTEVSIDADEDTLDIGLSDDDSLDLDLSMETDPEESEDLDLDLDPSPEK